MARALGRSTNISNRSDSFRPFPYTEKAIINSHYARCRDHLHLVGPLVILFELN